MNDLTKKEKTIVPPIIVTVKRITSNKGKHMIDTRLDFITKIDPAKIEMMTALRKKFVDLEKEMRKFEDLDWHDDNVQAAMHSLSMTTTHLGTSCMYAIKTLCLIGELK